MASTLLKLSPSSATDFKSCPQLFKYRAIDRLHEPVSGAAARGSLVHAVLERLYAEPSEQRTPARAESLLHGLWQEVRTNPDIRPEGMRAEDEPAWLAQGRGLLRNLFKLEDPRAVKASQLEWWVEYELPDIHLRGIIDRLEEKEDGSWILTDYKTGKIPGESREHAAFFGLRFYALVCWKAFGVIASEIRLVYLSDPAVLTLKPNEHMLHAFEKQMTALGRAIKRASDLEDWRSRPTPYCMSCSFQNRCPAWVRTAPEVPEANEA